MSLYNTSAQIVLARKKIIPWLYFYLFFHICVLTPTALSNEALDYMLAKGTDFSCIQYTWNRKQPRPLNLNMSSSVVLFSFTVFMSFQYVQKFLKFSEQLKSSHSHVRCNAGRLTSFVRRAYGILQC